MQYLDRYNSFNEANEEKDKNNPVRSERLLNQAQRETGDVEDVNVQKTDILPTILFTDVVGSSKLWSDDPKTMMEQLKEHHKLVNSLSAKNNGWIVKTIGDAFMVYFEPSSDSLENALRFAKDLIVNEKKYQLRIGACQGQMQEETYRIQKVDLKDFYGNPVNTSSRMESKVAGEAGVVAFTSMKDLSSNQLNNINSKIGKVMSVDLSEYDLRGATAKKAYRIKLK